jgi:hypothetical protein
MSREILNRLRAQTIVLNDLPTEVIGRSRDVALSEMERTHLRPLNEAAVDLLRRLSQHADLVEEAKRLAAKGRRRGDETLHMEATIAFEIDRIVEDIASANGHVFLALGVEQQFRHRELAVLRLLREAEQIGTGAGPAARL